MFGKLISRIEQGYFESLAKSGKLACPQCQEQLQAIPQRMNEACTCSGCGYFGSISEWNSSDDKRVGRADQPPADTRITMESGVGTRIWNIPASGQSGGFLVFGWIWSIFVGGMFILALTMGAMGKGKINDEPATFIGALQMVPYMLPFIAVGAGMLYFGYRSKKASHKVEIGAGRIVLTRDWLGKKEKFLLLADVESIEQVVFYSQNYQPVRGLEIKGKAGKLRFGSSLKEEEKAWLVADFKRTVWPEAAKVVSGAAYPQEETEVGGTKPFSVVLPKSSGWKNLGLPLTMIGVVFLVFGFFMNRDQCAGSSHASGFADVFDVVFSLLNGGFRLIWCLISIGMFVGGVGCLTKAIRDRGVEIRLEGDERQLALRKTRKGLPLSEQVFPREEFRGIRASNAGQMNGRTMMKIELLLGNRVEKIAGWLEESRASAVVAEIKRAML